MRLLHAATVVAIALASRPQPAVTQSPAQAAPPRLVSVEVSVLNGDGTWHAGLGRDDFSVAVDGEARPIERFTSDDRPVTAVILFDVSASCGINRLSALKSAVEKRLPGEMGTADRARVGTVGAGPVVLSPAFTSERKALRSALSVLDLPELVSDDGYDANGFTSFPGVVAPAGNSGLTGARMGPSPIWDAVFAAAGVLETEPGRRAIILITDGQSTGNVHGLNDAMTRAIAASVPVTTISLRTDRLISVDRTIVARVRPSVLLEELAHSTGGEALVIGQGIAASGAAVRFYASTPSIDQIAASMAVALQLAHHTYGITFAAPPPDDRLHRLEVRVEQPALTVRAPVGLLIRTAGVLR